MSYQPIENYGVIGDLHSVALIGMKGEIGTKSRNFSSKRRRRRRDSSKKILFGDTWVVLVKFGG